MAIKSCRHASQALKIAEFRRGLRHHDALGCELCAAPPVRSNHRSKPTRRRVSTSPETPDALGTSSNSTGNDRAPGGLTPAQTLKGWSPNPAWEDLYVCITCGYMACMAKNHLMQHFQIHSKHYVLFHVASRTFWCCPCKHEIDTSKGKTQDHLRACDGVFEEIATKQQRRVKNRLVTNPTLSPEDDEYPDSQRSYVADEDSRRISATEDLSAIQNDPTDTASSSSSSSSTLGPSQSPEDSGLASNRGKLSSGPQPPQPAVARAPSTPTPTSHAPTVLGFSNVGNTCYFNAATQALLTVLHCFPSFVYENDLINRMPTSPIVATLMMLQQTIRTKTHHLLPPASTTSTKKSKSKTPAPPVLTVAPLLKEMRKKFAQFRGSYQQDAHELFTSILWAIDEEIDPPTPPTHNVPPPTTVTDTPSQLDALVNIFVKTDTGETLSLRVAPDASVDQIQAMLATKLALDNKDVYLHLQPTATTPRPTMARRSTTLSRTPDDHLPVYAKVNFVRSLFSGTLTTEVRCWACGHCSETTEDAFQLSLPIPSLPNGRSMAVKDCLVAFTAETALQVDAENGYDCDKCSRPSASSPPSSLLLRDATMRQRVSALPRMLVLHLKRLGRLRKITQHIQFDAMLDMGPHVDDDVLERVNSTLYELVAVVVHKGNKRAGHYVAYVSRKRLPPTPDADADIDEVDWSQTTRSTLWKLEDPDHDWFYVSDTLVQPVPFENVLKCEAYMLFYQQVAPSESPRFSVATMTSSTRDIEEVGWRPDSESLGTWI